MDKVTSRLDSKEDLERAALVKKLQQPVRWYLQLLSHLPNSIHPTREKYKIVNRRRFMAGKDIKYPLPCDEEEADRLNTMNGYFR
ncbi:hypothetical protein BC938DRAFT_482634 [Jimgerdemannia flammicorona]|uniref:Uncharacterized protein n=2 Tax=Jimgerdemannia flammicorona TaxID=994334 RepID=A0A433QDP7_9FUNG|nr:hypothetical protein BC938DRAFT_482634 [Jimgerdemannia flammicorona]